MHTFMCDLRPCLTSPPLKPYRPHTGQLFTMHQKSCSVSSVYLLSHGFGLQGPSLCRSHSLSPREGHLRSEGHSEWYVHFGQAPVRSARPRGTRTCDGRQTGLSARHLHTLAALCWTLSIPLRNHRRPGVLSSAPRLSKWASGKLATAIVLSY